MISEFFSFYFLHKTEKNTIAGNSTEASNWSARNDHDNAFKLNWEFFSCCCYVFQSLLLLRSFPFSLVCVHFKVPFIKRWTLSQEQMKIQITQLRILGNKFMMESEREKEREFVSCGKGMKSMNEQELPVDEMLFPTVNQYCCTYCASRIPSIDEVNLISRKCIFSSSISTAYSSLL